MPGKACRPTVLSQGSLHPNQIEVAGPEQQVVVLLADKRDSLDGKLAIARMYFPWQRLDAQPALYIFEIRLLEPAGETDFISTQNFKPGSDTFVFVGKTDTRTLPGDGSTPNFRRKCRLSAWVNC